MGLILAFVRVLFLTLLLVWFADAGANNGYRVFNVKKFGAVSDGRTESSKAFLKAWTEACRWHGRAMVLIPRGVYILDSVLFLGECNGYMAFILKGVLKPKRSLQACDQWITFRYIKGFLLGGGGTLDGEGYKYWNRSDCLRNHNCHPLAIHNLDEEVMLCKPSNSSRFFVPVTETRVHPKWEGQSYKINQQPERPRVTLRLYSLEARTFIFLKSNAAPGMELVLGSMGGKGSMTESVVGVTVRDCTFNGTSDGARIKTWASSTTGFASNFIYENIRMMNVGNPIIIDQDYCPYPPCDMKNPSRIQIKDITFNNIWGTSESDVAVTLNCSRTVPCKNIRLKDINLFHGSGGSVSSLCSNVRGTSYGRQKPPSCL
ncbi:PECTIN LYASE-LIKE SUPERFAMILY PROTEIN [Salix purpurea]|uniref:PECTIN LYASE-LIKE SUPERFAMILY PROTEIN n=1 Tax=Salix purpurea TaxID=77065 RepID=A0A9Q1A0W7_SALPP|nr:PECTIN LYASE-LIKE SUPERFAMILY PROTEIN [Salix purpurea]